MVLDSNGCESATRDGQGSARLGSGQLHLAPAQRGLRSAGAQLGHIVNSSSACALSQLALGSPRAGSAWAQRGLDSIALNSGSARLADKTRMF